MNLVVVKIRSSPSFRRDSGANRCGRSPSTVGGWTLLLFSETEAFSIFFRSHFHLQDECSTDGGPEVPYPLFHLWRGQGAVLIR